MVRRWLSSQDVIWLSGAVLAAIFVMLEFDIFTDNGQESAREQAIELNELLLFGPVLVIAAFAFAWHRHHAHRKEFAARIAAEGRAHSAARYDPLTGLANRLSFVERTGAALDAAGKGGSQCAVLFLDLDGFKPVNDTHGHATGDAVLAEVAHRLRRSVPDPLNVGRLGGDEFALLIESAENREGVELTARRIVREICRPVLIDGKSITVGATVGIAFGPESGRQAEMLIHAADLAMYEGKRAGKGTVRLFKVA